MKPTFELEAGNEKKMQICLKKFRDVCRHASVSGNPHQDIQIADSSTFHIWSQILWSDLRIPIAHKSESGCLNLSMGEKGNAKSSLLGISSSE